MYRPLTMPAVLRDGPHDARELSEVQHEDRDLYVPVHVSITLETFHPAEARALTPVDHYRWEGESEAGRRVFRYIGRIE